MIALCSTRPADLAGVLRRGAVVLIVFIGFSVYFSPQWVLWLAPLCLPLRVEVGFSSGWCRAGPVTYFTFPVYSPVWGPMELGGAHRAVYARFAAFAAGGGVIVAGLCAARQAGAGRTLTSDENAVSPVPL